MDRGRQAARDLSPRSDPARDAPGASCAHSQVASRTTSAERSRPAYGNRGGDPRWRGPAGHPRNAPPRNPRLHIALRAVKVHQEMDRERVWRFFYNHAMGHYSRRKASGYGEYYVCPARAIGYGEGLQPGSQARALAGHHRARPAHLTAPRPRASRPGLGAPRTGRAARIDGCESIATGASRARSRSRRYRLRVVRSKPVASVVAGVRCAHLCRGLPMPLILPVAGRLAA